MESFFYRVKPNDTLKSISLKFKIPSTVIIADNFLRQEIEVGDLLILNVPIGNVYFISPTDTLNDLCFKFNVSKEYILNKNKTPYLIYGEFIVI